MASIKRVTTNINGGPYFYLFWISGSNFLQTTREALSKSYLLFYRVFTTINKEKQSKPKALALSFQYQFFQLFSIYFSTLFFSRKICNSDITKSLFFPVLVPCHFIHGYISGFCFLSILLLLNTKSFTSNANSNQFSRPFPKGCKWIACKKSNQGTRTP